MGKILSCTRFLDALKGENEGRPPIWLMRQAGRYLPEYRALRSQWKLKELFFTPELAAEATLMPIQRFGVDAAILFSDITVIALCLGLKLDFNEGPVIDPLVSVQDVERLPVLDPREMLDPVRKTVEILRGELEVPLIGFCGGPFTVASYLIEKHSGHDLPATKKWIYRHPEALKALLDKIAEASIGYLKMQTEAGAEAVQIFDSWAHVLSKEHWIEFCYPVLKRMIDEVDKPAIVFMRGASFRADELASLRPAGISFDWLKPMSEFRERVPRGIAVQGNLDPDLLYAPIPEIRKEAVKLLRSMEGESGFIVNLGHGVKPDVPVEAVECLVDTVKRFNG